MKRGKKANAMYVIEFPAGTKLRFPKLDWTAVQTLQDQCSPRDIDKLVSVETGIEYFLDLSRRRRSFLYSDSNSIPFQSENGETPSHGSFKLYLKDNVEAGVEVSVCGSLCEWINAPNRDQKAREVIGTQLRLYYATCPTADVNCTVAVIADNLYITLDYMSHLERLMTIQLTENIIDTNSHKAFGGISGQVCLLAQILPYAMLLEIVMSFDINKVVFTGEGWSGSVAHAAAIMFRELFKAAESPPIVAAISFSGPLCASSKLHEHLAASGQKENHTTINCGGIVLDRLISNYQRLSPFAETDVSTWKVLYDPFRDSLRGYLEGSTVIDFEALQQAEDNLANRRLSEKYVLLPIGFLMKKGAGETKVFPSEDIIACFRTLQSCSPPSWKVYCSLRNETISSWTPVAVNDVNIEGSRPAITAVSMIQTQTAFTIHFEGINLDCVQKRLMDKDILINSETIGDLPFHVATDRFDIESSQAKLVRVRCFPNKAIIDMSGLSLRGPGSITLKTDFGSTNALPYTEDNIIHGEDSAHSKSLHPTMNAEFLSSALLRVAIVVKESGTGLDELQEKNPAMYDLWCILLDLEKNLFDMPEPLLHRHLTQFLSDQIDIGQLKHMCQKVFEEMSRQATADMPIQQSSAAYRGMQTVVGGILALAGGVLTLAGILLSVPAAILAIPVHRVLSDLANDRAEGVGIGARAYLGVVGVAGLPGVIVGLMGMFLRGAAAHAMSDYASHNYKQILIAMINILGGNHLEVVDELPQLEDHVVFQLDAMFPGLDFGICTEDDVRKCIERGQAKEDKNIVKFAAATKKFSLLIKKLLTVGRIHAIRQILLRNLMIGFVGVHNAGKSTTISALLEVDTGADILIRTERPVPFQIGSWVDQCAQTHPQFNEWLQSKDRNSTQLYAVDFPGTTDERETIKLVTRYTLELVSMFVIVLKASHIAGPEKEVVDLVKNANKPFIVVINQCDIIAHELKKPGNEDRIRNHYASVLNVPSRVIQFASAFDSSSNDKLRGIIFGILQSLISNTEIVKALALRLTPPSAVGGLDEAVIGVPDKLAESAYSLLFNLCPMRKETLEAACRTMLYNFAESERRQAKKVDLRTVSFGAMDMVRQMAMTFDFDALEYEVYMQIIHRRNMSFKPFFDRIIQVDTASSSHVEMLVSTLALASLRDDLFGFLKESSSSSAGDLPSMASQVFNGFRAILNRWVGADCKKEAVLRALLATFDTSGDRDESAFYNKVREYEDTMAILQDGHESKTDTADILVEVSLIDNDYGFNELNRYRLARDQLDRLMGFKYQPCNILAYQSPTNDVDIMSEISKFQRETKQYVDTHLQNTVGIEISSDEGVLEPLLKVFSNLTQEQMMTMDFRIKIRGDPAIDVNGVTRGVLTKAALELAEHPEKVFMRQDDESNLLYFDPEKCIATRASDPVKYAEILGRFRSLGRLIGFALVKSNVGVTLPLNFPLAIYKILLGMKIGTSDLNVFNPEIVSTAQKLFTSQFDIFEDCGLTFSVYVGSTQETFELCPNGEERDVSKENVMDYLYQYMRYHLCCVEDVDNKNPMLSLLLGLQDMCPRELFRSLSPVAMQLILQGSQEIDMDQWKQYTVVSSCAASASHVVDWFWEVVAAMTELDKRNLLSFVIGTAHLPAKGFEELPSGPFTIEISAILSVNDLPTTHTCFNILTLPRYTSQRQLQDKLLMAIRETDASTYGLL